jgi:Family of unknown function (DUF5989)
MGPNPPSEFSRQAAQGQRGFFREMWDFMRHNKKWWLTPILVILILAGALVILGGSGLAPFIYTIF